MLKKFLSVTLPFTMTLSMGISKYAAYTSINPNYLFCDETGCWLI